MTMHLLPPMFSTTGKKKGKAKFRNAESANKARRNAEAWQELLNKWEVKSEAKTTKVRTTARFNPVVSNSPVVDPKRLTHNIPSVVTGVGVAVKKPVQQYTGDAMIGLGQLHKSNTVPIFKAQDAVDIAKMRRG